MTTRGKDGNGSRREARERKQSRLSHLEAHHNLHFVRLASTIYIMTEAQETWLKESWVRAITDEGFTGSFGEYLTKLKGGR